MRPIEMPTSYYWEGYHSTFPNKNRPMPKWCGTELQIATRTAEWEAGADAARQFLSSPNRLK